MERFGLNTLRNWFVLLDIVFLKYFFLRNLLTDSRLEGIPALGRSCR